MNIKRFSGSDMRTAIRSVREELGSEAVILSTQQSGDGVEIVAAVDYDMETDPPISPAPAYDIHGSAQAGLAQETESVKGLKQEMKSLRFLLETQLTQLAWNERSRRTPIEAQAMRNLSRLGLSAALVKTIIGELGEMKDYEDAWQMPLRKLLAHIPFVPLSELPDSGIVALVGPTGAGKTTAIARLATRHTLEHGRGSLALLSADNVRVGARDQLRAYGQIIGAPVYVAGDATEFRAVLQDLSRTRLVLVDTAGVGHRDLRLTPQNEMLRDPSLGIRCLLTLPANAQPEALPEIIDAFAAIEPEACMLTKIDEAASLGGALSAVIARNLPLAWLSNGQRVPEDMYPADPRREWLLRVAIGRLRDSKTSVSEHYMADNFQEVPEHAEA